MNKNMNYDVVIIGSGGAGLRASISSAQNGCKTLVITRGKANRSGATLLAGANISADIGCDGRSLYEMGFKDANKNDSKQKWFDDLIVEGFYVNDQDLVRLFVEDAEKRVRELIEWGMKVKGLEGERGISVEGSDILDTLTKKAKALGVDFIEDTMITDIVVEDNMVNGVIALDILLGEISFIGAKSVIIATGGMHSIFPFTTGSTDLYGDGQAAALRAGCELVDMEYISFCPLVIKHPERYKGNLVPYIMHTMGFGDILNKCGKDFINIMYSRDVASLALNSEWNKLLISYAMQTEIQNGKGTKEDGVYFGVNNFPRQVYDEMYRELPALTRGIYKEITSILQSGNGIVVAPAAHYFEGGINVDGKTMETKVRGLFAAGECTGGLFGANRVSAATTEMLVEGALAGDNAAENAKKSNIKLRVDNLEKYIEPLMKPFNKKDGISVIQLRKHLQQSAKDGLWVIRRAENMEKCYNEVKDVINNKLDQVCLVNSTKVYNKEWIEYIGLRNMCMCLGAVAKAAMLRTESRGVHIREDYTITDNENWLKKIIIQDTEFNHRFEKVNLSEATLPKNKLDFKDFIVELVDKLN